MESIEYAFDVIVLLMSQYFAVEAKSKVMLKLWKVIKMMTIMSCMSNWLLVAERERNVFICQLLYFNFMFMIYLCIHLGLKYVLYYI